RRSVEQGCGFSAGCAAVSVAPDCETRSESVPAPRLPLRAVFPSLACAVSVSVALPLPFAGETASHGELLFAFQAHPAGTVSATLLDCAAEPRASVEGEALKVHGIPACRTVMVRPAMRTVPLRSAGTSFACSARTSLPSPEPPAGDTASQGGESLCAFQLQP